jgi:hypothetical protein
MRDAESRGEEIIGVWHSHTHTDAYPSPTQMVGEHLRSAAEKGFTARVGTLLAHGVEPQKAGEYPFLGTLLKREQDITTAQRVLRK